MTGGGRPPAGPSPSGPAGPLVELVDIRKTFGDLVANDGITLDVRPGEIHALLGENGAGKSTLVRVLYGLSRPDAGVIRVGGTPVQIHSPADAIAAGLGMVTQEFSLVGPMTVTENLVLAGSRLGRVDLVAARERVRVAADRLGVRVDPDAVVADLSVGERQRVEILKALHRDCRVLILDEPTAVLTPQDARALFAALRRLTAEGIGVLLITHKLHEVVEVAQRVSVLRRGRLTATLDLATPVSPRRLAALMVGAEAAEHDELEVGLPTAHGGSAASDPAALGAGDADVTGGTPHESQASQESQPRRDRTGGDEPASPPALGTHGGALGTHGGALEMHGGALEMRGALEMHGVRVDGPGRPVLDVDEVVVRGGEVVGVAGVSGNGQTELVEVLCGVRPVDGGRVLVGGRDVTGASPVARLAAGLGRITEDRKGSVVGAMSVEQNLVLEDLDAFRRGPFVDRRAVRRHAERLIAQYDIRAKPSDAVRTLSGGNMQKVLLARALARDPRALVVSQPTRGLDVGAAAYVHEQLRGLRASGAGVLLVSDDLDEVLALADRVVVLFEGRVAGVLPGGASPEQVGLLMAGGRSGAAA